MALTPSEDGRDPDDATEKDYRRIAGMDSAANWLLNDALDDYLPDPEGQMVPLLIELDDEPAVKAFNDVLSRRDAEGGAVVIGFDLSNDRVRAGTLLPVLVSLKWIEQLLDKSPQSKAFRSARKRIGLSTPTDSLPGQATSFPEFEKIYTLPLNVPPADLPPSTVVMAVIDDGFAFAHERFRTADDKTRLLTCWDMQGVLKPANPKFWELDYTEINQLMADASTDGRIDEDAVYAAGQQIDFSQPKHKPLAYRVSHGTHVLDLAAGYEPEEAITNRPIIVAQFPSRVVASTAGEMLDFYIWMGVTYALSRAAALAPGKPLVINISYGYLAGPHDGLGALDKFLDAVVADPDRTTRIVLPAGNSQRSRCHATMDLTFGPVAFDWIVQPDDRTHSTIEIWLPPTATAEDGVSLTVTLPNLQTVTVPNGPSTSEKVIYRGKTAGRVELIERDDGRLKFRVSIAPTERAQPHTGALAPAGVWQLRLAAAKPLDGPAHAWCQRDDSLYGYPQKGRQSYFDHDLYQRFDARGFELDDDRPGDPLCPVTRTSLLSGIASGKNVIVAGGYNTRDGRIARYSSGGPNTPPEPAPLQKPDALAPTDASPVHFGILAAGARSGTRVAQDGTSVASPQIARRVADMVSGLPPGGGGGTRADVAAAAVPSQPGQPKLPMGRGSAGRLSRLDAPPLERVTPGD